MDAQRWGGRRTNCRRHSTRRWVLYGTTPLVHSVDRLHKNICGRNGAAIFLGVVPYNTLLLLLPVHKGLNDFGEPGHALRLHDMGLKINLDLPGRGLLDRRNPLAVG